jgi:hypothetical protein
MKSVRVDEETFRRLKGRALQKGMTVTDYVSSLVPSVEKVGS